MATPKEIDLTFQQVCEEQPDDKSTPFLIQLTADRLQISYNAVVNGLSAIHGANARNQ